MTNFENAERLRKLYLSRTPRKGKKNICQALPKWNGCDYCDIYAGRGLECWEQTKKHNRCHCKEV